MNTTSTLDNTRKMASDAMGRASDAMREYTQLTTRYVGEHPMKTAMIAAAVGAAVAGLVIALRRHRSDSF